MNPAAVSVIHSLADLFHAKSIVWQTLLGSYCAGLHLLCPMKIVTCSDYGKEFEQLERQGLRFLSQEQATHGRILVHDATIEGMTTLVSTNLEARIRRHPGEDWTLVCPYPCRSLENLGRDRGWTVITQPWRRAEWLADKHNFFDGLDQIGLPRMPGRWVRWPEARYSELTTEIGPRFVAQLSRGSSGSGTFFIGSREDFIAAGARFGRELVWVAPNLGPLALNINAVALSRSAVASCPSVQLVGLERLGANPGGYAGNDFSAVSELPAATIRDVQEQTERIGSWIASLGYRGLFGLDFVIDRESGTNYAVDLNPRWQGSTALEVQAQLRAGRMPLAAAELAWRLGLLGEADVARRRDDFRMPVRGSQLILRSRMSGDSKVTRGVAAGVYEMSPTLNYSGEGVMLGDCRSPGQLLVTGGVPLRDTVLAPGAFVARIVSERAAVSFATMDLQTMDLRRWAQNAARELYDALGIEAVSPGSPG